MSENGRDPYRGLLNLMRGEAAAQISSAFVVGKVLEVTGKTIRIQADGLELDEQYILINAALVPDFEEEAELTMASDELTMRGKLNGSASPCPNGSHSYFTVNSISDGSIADKKAVYKVPFRLKAGDLVMLMPDADRQLYYLVCKVVRYGAVSAD